MAPWLEGSKCHGTRTCHGWCLHQPSIKANGMFSVAGEDSSHGGPTLPVFVVYRHGWCLHQPSIKANGMFSVAGGDTSHGVPTSQVMVV